MCPNSVQTWQDAALSLDAWKNHLSGQHHPDEHSFRGHHAGAAIATAILAFHHGLICRLYFVAAVTGRARLTGALRSIPSAVGRLDSPCRASSRAAPYVISTMVRLVGSVLDEVTPNARRHTHIQLTPRANAQRSCGLLESYLPRRHGGSMARQGLAPLAAAPAFCVASPTLSRHEAP